MRAVSEHNRVASTKRDGVVHHVTRSDSAVRRQDQRATMLPTSGRPARSLSKAFVDASIQAIQAQRDARATAIHDELETSDPLALDQSLAEINASLVQSSSDAAARMSVLSDLRVARVADHGVASRPDSRVSDEAATLKRHREPELAQPCDDHVASADAAAALSIVPVRLESVRAAWLAPLIAQITQQADEIERLRAPMARLNAVVGRLEEHLNLLEQTRSRTG
jgi:hypothetical protein